jgi:CRISPR/Cas system-associated endonuclease Cas1
MRKHSNTLFITLEGAYLRKDGAAIEIRHDGETKLRVPLHKLDGIACFGWDISCSAALMAACAEANAALSFHNPHGKFLAAPYFLSPGTRTLMLRKSTWSPWSWRRRWPSTHSPKPGIFLYLLMATRSLNSLEPRS